MPKAREDSWSVVCVAKESPEVIQRFVAWHLAAGARAITIFFDDPDDPNIEMVAHLDQVLAVACTDEFWKSLGLNAGKRFTKRQNAACRLGYDAAETDWVLNIDADELLYCENRSIGHFLSDLPKECRSVLVEPAERVWIKGHEEQELFRQKMTREQIDRVYGDIAGFVIRNSGFVGHDVGKSLIRTGITDFWLRQHFGQLKDGTKIVDATVGATDGIHLLHFFSRGYDDWRRKLDYRLANQGFRHRMRAALAEARDAGDEDALRNYYLRLHFVDDEQIEYLRQVGKVLQPDLNLPKLMDKYFPD